MEYRLNLAKFSILETLERAAVDRELVYVRAGQRCLGKTTALIEFARKYDCEIMVHRNMLGYYKDEHPEVKVRSHMSEEWVTPSDRFVCDEGVPQGAIDALRRGGNLITGFVKVNHPLGDVLHEQLIRENTTNLLTIELTDEQSIPRVIYKGEELTGSVAVEFLWHTDNANGKVPTYINIEKHNGNCNIERITYNPDSADVKRYNLYGDLVDE
ncbi:oxidoreductase [Bacillus amyloliquefaciens]|uniref:oxidoreductase n=1 Tax=Bacillus amyloliquefaciens TaxID=1390 RepID=UPI00228262BA|nr:oxidoreductase [Bacillus amyloliquefaciens]MCY7423529.1 oxidoreductase [Bacillus amyloliquefaciens]MEC0966136.1 oxidoreductase [Bacillus amyloliquefaciens]MEC1012965.1 oxidoreductase [Bacillus amyloliquefaciens]